MPTHEPPPRSEEEQRNTPRPSRHPLMGCMTGTVTIPPGVDLTEPMFTDAEMDAFADRKMGILRGEGT